MPIIAAITLYAGVQFASPQQTIHVGGREVSSSEVQQIQVIKQGNETVVVYE